MLRHWHVATSLLRHTSFPPSSPVRLIKQQANGCALLPYLVHLPTLRRYQLNATQELRGLGIANLAGAMFNCYTTTGSFSRSAVNNSVG